MNEMISGWCFWLIWINDEIVWTYDHLELLIYLITHVGYKHLRFCHRKFRMNVHCWINIHFASLFFLLHVFNYYLIPIVILIAVFPIKSKNKFHSAYIYIWVFKWTQQQQRKINWWKCCWCCWFINSATPPPPPTNLPSPISCSIICFLGSIRKTWWRKRFSRTLAIANSTNQRLSASSQGQFMFITFNHFSYLFFLLLCSLYSYSRSLSISACSIFMTSWNILKISKYI